jgi:hypothetical protein
MRHQVQYRRRNREGVVVSLYAFFGWVFKLWVVEQEGYSVGLVVGVVDGGTPLADEGDTVIAVANRLGQYRSSQGEKQGKGMGTRGGQATS